MSREAMRLAGQQLGLNEQQQNAALREYMANGGVNLDPAVTAWCAGFVNASLAQAGIQGTDSLAARSFENWGQAVDDPQPGDIAVFSRGDPNGWQGHVGFFQGYDEDGNVLVLGGNQGNSVSVAPYSANRLLGFRRAPGEETMMADGGNALAVTASTRSPQGGNGLARMGQDANALADMEQRRQMNMPQINALNPQDFQVMTPTPQPLPIPTFR